MQRQAGLTLLELLIALAVVAVLLGVAVPAWSAAGEATRAAAARASLQDSLDAALRFSTAIGTEVVICPGTRGGCRDAWDWSGGWIVFADRDGDRAIGAGESLLREAPPLAGQVHLRSTRGRRRLVFHPHGGAAAGTNVTFTLCDGRGPAKARALVLANSGRLRSTPAKQAAADACMDPA